MSRVQVLADDLLTPICLTMSLIENPRSRSSRAFARSSVFMKILAKQNDPIMWGRR